MGYPNLRAVKYCPDGRWGVGFDLAREVDVQMLRFQGANP